MLKGLSLLAAAEAGAAVKRQAIAYALYAAAAVVGLFALAFLLAALHTWLTMRMSSVEASLYIALGLAVIAGVIFAIGSYRKSRRATPSPLAATAAVAAPLAAQTLLRRANLGAVGLVAVLIGGALIGRRIARD